MSIREIVHDLLQRLPADVSLHEVARKIKFVAVVRQGLAESGRGERVSLGDTENEIRTWIVR